MPLPLATLVPAALAGGFAVGKLVLGSGGGSAGDAVPAAPAVDRLADPSAGTDAIDFGWGQGAGTLNGITPGSGYDSGGLPGGGDATLPPDPVPVTLPPPSPPAGQPGTRPAATGTITFRRGTYHHYAVSGKKVTRLKDFTTKGFTARCTAPATYVSAGQTYSLVRLLQGGSAVATGWWVSARAGTYR